MIRRIRGRSIASIIYGLSGFVVRNHPGSPKNDNYRTKEKLSNGCIELSCKNKII